MGFPGFISNTRGSPRASLGLALSRGRVYGRGHPSVDARALSPSARAARGPRESPRVSPRWDTPGVGITPGITRAGPVPRSGLLSRSSKMWPPSTCVMRHTHISTPLVVLTALSSGSTKANQNVPTPNATKPYTRTKGKFTISNPHASHGHGGGRPIRPPLPWRLAPWPLGSPGTGFNPGWRVTPPPRQAASLIVRPGLSVRTLHLRKEGLHVLFTARWIALALPYGLYQSSSGQVSLGRNNRTPRSRTTRGTPSRALGAAQRSPTTQPSQ